MEGTERTFDRLQKQRILPSSEIPPHEFLFTWHDIPCFARGELVAVTGKAKSGKTYLNSILMAAGGTPQSPKTKNEVNRAPVAENHQSPIESERFLGLTRIQEKPLTILWIDTEQSEDSTHEILRDRIGAMIGEEPSPERFYVFNLRQVSLKDRELMVETAIYCYQPDLVIFDGIRDIVSDINDYAEAQRVIGILLSIASDKHNCIVCVLHQNKAIEDKTLRGALGTELQNKSFETYECSKDDDRVFTIRQAATRKYDIPNKQKFIVNPEGLPVPFLGEDSPAPIGNTDTKFNPMYLTPDGRFDQKKLFGYILQNGRRMAPDQLRQVVMRVGNIKSFNFAGKLIEEAKFQGLIGQVYENGRSTMGCVSKRFFDRP